MFLGLKMAKLNHKNIERNINKLKKIMQPNRVKILYILDKKETCACELVSQLKLPNNLVSHHLKVLSDLGILKSRKIGLHIKYSIRKRTKKPISKLLNCMRFYAEYNK